MTNPGRADHTQLKHSNAPGWKERSHVANATTIRLRGSFTQFLDSRLVRQSYQLGTKNGEWPAYAGDLSNYRYSPLDQINASNFSKLEVTWRFKTDNLGTRPEYKLEGTPIMVKGVVYATAGTRRSVVALDAATGELRGSTANMKARGAPQLHAN